MNVGAAGSSMIFFCLTALQVFVALGVLSYVSHSLLVIVEQTAAGNDAVAWPDEPLLDWAWKLFYLGWICALCTVPTWLLLNAVNVSSSTSLILIVLIPWLLFPIELLSSLSASSRWIILQPKTILRMLRHPVALFALYAVSGLLFAGAVMLIWIGLSTPMLIPVAATVTAAAIMVYGRLLGCIGLRLRQDDLRRQDEEEDEMPPEAEEAVARDPWAGPPQKKYPQHAEKRRPKVEDPWALPESQPAPATDQVLTPDVYKITENAPVPVSASPRQPDLDEPGYNVLPAPEVKPLTKKDKTHPDPIASPEVMKREMEFVRRREKMATLPVPTIGGVFSFPLYGTSLGALAWMTCGLSLMGAIGYCQLLFLPSP